MQTGKVNLTQDDEIIIKFLGGKTVPHKASPDTKSNSVLDYYDIVFENKIIPDFSSLKPLRFNSDWNLLMIIRRKLIEQGFVIDITSNYIRLEYRHHGDLTYRIDYKEDGRSEIDRLHTSLVFCIIYYNENEQLFK